MKKNRKDGAVMKRWKNALKKFIDHFGYTPNDPINISDVKEKYPEILERSVKDDFDYTIEVYGTDPNKNKKYDKDAIIID